MAAVPLPTPDNIENDIPPRFQWNANNGYCGETSMICAGLYYGQYLSQFDVRRVAIDGRPQDGGNSAQLLLGVNDQHTAQELRLAHEEWADSQCGRSAEFLAWVKRHVVQGHPVIIGVYDNRYPLHPDQEGDPEYDHIVPVTGFGSWHVLADGEYHPDDVILFSDNGLYTPDNKPVYYFHYRLQDFQADREQANRRGGPPYALADKTRNYAIAITGVLDEGNVTLPVRVATSRNDEVPAMVDKTNVRPAPMPLVLTVTVSGLQAGQSYNLYRYDRVDAVPTSAFNAQAGRACATWQIAGTPAGNWTTQVSIMSDEIAIFRAVGAGAA